MKSERKKRLLLLPLLFLFLLSGCASMFERDYFVTSEHVEDYVEIRDDESVQNVRNYTGMKNALLNLVNSASEAGVITTKNYSGDARDDISRACLEVTRETPMGVYAVDYMTHEASQILSYYEIHIYISYKRSEEEIASIVSVNSGPAFQELLKTALHEFTPNLCVLIASTNITEEEIRSFVDGYYANNPIELVEYPDMQINAYPAFDAVQKIISVDFNYSTGSEGLREIKSSLAEAVERYITGIEAEDEAGVLLELCRRLSDGCRASSVGALPADALLHGRASSRAYAFTLKLLCNLVNIPCTIVEGTHGDEAYFWNIVQLGDSYYHVDPYAFDAEGPAIGFLLPDSEMLKRCRWTRSETPACSGTLTYAIVAGLPTPEEEVPPEEEPSEESAEEE